VMKVQRIRTSDAWKRAIATNLELGRAAREAERRRLMHFPLRNRWLIVRARTRTTWREVWTDLGYLIRG